MIIDWNSPDPVDYDSRVILWPRSRGGGSAGPGPAPASITITLKVSGVDAHGNPVQINVEVQP